MSKQTELAQVADTITVDSGNVGIGTSSPNGKLDITGSGNTDLYLNTGNNSGDNTRIFFGDTADIDVAYLAYDHGTNSMLFGANAAERMRIDSSGNLLVGTTSILDAGSENAIHIQGSTSAAKWCMVTQSHSRGRVHVHTSSGGISDYFITGSTNVGAISQSTTSTSYATSSDYRLKTDAQPMTGASARVQALNPVNFEWIADGTRVDGFLAHEAQEVVPEAVTGTKDAVDADGNPEYQGIDQSKLVPLLTAALQEALTKIDALETRITALEG